MAIKLRRANTGDFKLKVPKKIKNIIGDLPYSVETIGLSNSQVFCFDDMVLKVEKEGEESNNEYQMMAWLHDKLPVPRVLCFEKENGVNYLLMSKIEGDMACSPELLADHDSLVKLLANGLRMLWDVNVAKCSYNNSIDNKLKLAKIRVYRGLCNLDDAYPITEGENVFENPQSLLKWLKDNRPEETLVFSHGDYCLPNIFTKDGEVSGFIDLGRSGKADPYQDIALCYRSLKYNYNGMYGGKVYEGFDPGILFNELKLEPDWHKIEYFILLNELF